MNLNAKIKLQELFSNRISFDKTERKLYGHDIAAMPGIIKPFIGYTANDWLFTRQGQELTIIF